MNSLATVTSLSSSSPKGSSPKMLVGAFDKEVTSCKLLLDGSDTVVAAAVSAGVIVNGENSCSSSHGSVWQLA